MVSLGGAMEAQKKQPRLIISENTGITVGVLVIVVGAVFWLTEIYNTGRANAEAIVSIKDERKEYLDTVKSIDKRLSWVEGYMRVKKRTNGGSDE